MVITDISLVFIYSVLTYFFHSLLSHCCWERFNVTNPSTEDIVPTVDCATLLCSSQVDLLMWGGNSALNPARSLWQYYLWTVVGHTVFWGMPNAPSSKCKICWQTLHQSQFCLKPILTQIRTWTSTSISIGYKDQNVNQLSYLSSLLQSSIQWEPLKNSHLVIGNFCTMDLCIINHYIPSFTI